MAKKIRNVCVVGERVSGTCYLQSLISSNTGLKPVSSFGHKHFFQDIDAMKNADTSETLFVFVSRDLIDWLKSFKSSTYHADRSIRNCKDMTSFLQKEWKCVYDETSGTSDTSPEFGKEMMNERNPSDGRPFVNVIQMRNFKLRHFLSIEDYVDHFVHVRYEEVRDDPETFIETICEKYGLTLKNVFVNVETVRGKGKVVYKRSIYPELLPEDVELILSNVDFDLEVVLGYL